MDYKTWDLQIQDILIRIKLFEQLRLGFVIYLYAVYSVIFVLYHFSLQTWLADWLMNNNPNKPKISDGTVVKPTTTA